MILLKPYNSKKNKLCNNAISSNIIRISVKNIAFACIPRYNNQYTILNPRWISAKGRELRMKKDSLKLQSYNIIKDKIIRCEYAPNTLINEEALREELGVSRTPIRDALSRLEQEGLIQILPKKGIMVSGLSLSEINAIFEIRLLFEPHALATYGHRLNDEKMLEFYNICSQGEVLEADEFYRVDDEFHAFIIAATPNRYIQHTYELIQNQNLRFRVMTGQRPDDRLERSNNEHLTIIKACLRKDWMAAAAAMEEHLRQSKNSTFELLLNFGGV